MIIFIITYIYSLIFTYSYLYMMFNFFLIFMPKCITYDIFTQVFSPLLWFDELGTTAGPNGLIKDVTETKENESISSGYLYILYHILNKRIL
jgi:hypothetical protein